MKSNSSLFLPFVYSSCPFDLNNLAGRSQQKITAVTWAWLKWDPYVMLAKQGQPETEELCQEMTSSKLMFIDGKPVCPKSLTASRASYRTTKTVSGFCFVSVTEISLYIFYIIYCLQILIQISQNFISLYQIAK